MYKEEKVINGVLCVRYRPDAEFVPYTVEELTSKNDTSNDDIVYPNE
ncbi:MAG TPA: hypothetical protein VFC79_01270 [Tissierellaceae bacterium]|nr:hypothetical protein [Tissierellaceae bacterium]